MSFKTFKNKIYILGKFQCASLINYLFDIYLFINFHFDTTLIIFFRSTFSFF